MIWGIIAFISGLVLRSKAIVLIPVIYFLARKNKDLGLIAYFFYAVALMGDVFVKDIISFEALKVIFLGAFPALMVLREVLIGVEFKESYKLERSRLEFFLDVKAFLFVLIVVGLMVAVKIKYEYLYTTENQVAVAAGLALLFLLLTLREDVKRVGMFERKS
ncbi:hypothetical protein K1720_03070 [Thermococcus argininiproducens]|uniref:Uncharacterized protein n=1 Tax=Thermococcus argininiproducens TaxID=2866384 RepID=A0A9E7SCU8_9EURY|nr:hypothetical protein [Thermococcus argininiproducens]USH00459.1 hypothetical protein K1720_03070 [Thermococcus argininiproducens]